MRKMRKSGFTLIELLLIVALIGVLASVLVVAINPLKQMKKARDAGRKSDLKQMALALEGYYIAFGEYPHPCDRTQSEGGCSSAAGWGNASVLETVSSLKSLPNDPINDGFFDVWTSGEYSYFLVSETVGVGVEGEYYMLGAFLENTDDLQTLGNLPFRPYWPDCSGGIGFNANIFLIRSYHCPGDPEGSL